jgi:alkyl hydroperoxide reductase subunit AhpF
MDSRLRFRQWFVAVSRSSKDEIDTNWPVEEKDLVIIGGGVAGYVAAIKAGQEGMKVCLRLLTLPFACLSLADGRYRQHEC